MNLPNYCDYGFTDWKLGYLWKVEKFSQLKLINYAVGLVGDLKCLFGNSSTWSCV